MIGRLLAGGAALLAAAGAGLAAWGTTLPESVSAERTARIAAPADRVFALVTDVEGQGRWRSDVGRIEPGPGPDSWVEHQKSGDTLSFRIFRKEADQLFDIAWTSGSGIEGRWTGRFTPVGAAATEVGFVETVRIANPLMRATARLMVPPGGHIDLYLADLRRAAESGVGAQGG